MRETCLLLLCLAAACSDPPPPPVAVATKPGPRPPAVAPTTGISQIEKAHDSVAADIAALEDQDRTDERDTSVRQQIRLLDKLITAAEIALQAEAKQAVLINYRSLRLDRSAIIAKRNLVNEEIQAIDASLKAYDKRVGEIPAGFTEAEFRDKLSDLRLEDKALVKREAEVVEKMAEYEKLRDSPEPPAVGDSLIGRELKALRDLRRKADALLK